MFLSFKDFTACVLIACLFVSCKKDSREFYTSVEVTPVYIDSVNVRALAPIDENRVWFGANMGKVGLIDNDTPRSEEHTSELQSRPQLVCRLPLEKKKNSTSY